MPSLRFNLLANAFGTAVTALLGLASAPALFHAFGAEAYGLIGVFLMLQAMLPIVDAGITAGFARATAWYGGLPEQRGRILVLLRWAERWLLVSGATLALVAAWAAEDVATDWLQRAALPAGTVATCLRLIAAGLALRLLGGLYRAGLMALERQVEANLLLAAITLLRTFGALAFGMATNTGIVGFFLFQLPVGLLELTIARMRLRRALPAPQPLPADELRRHTRFALGIAGLAIVWVLASQADKLALSRFLSLDEYGLYSLGVHLAMVVLLAAAPVQQAVLPRLTRLLAADGAVEQLYLLASALLITLVIALTTAIAAFVEPLVRLLRPEAAQAAEIGRIALWYAIGNAAVAVLTMAYLLQNAHGRLRLHAIGSTTMALSQIALMSYVASTSGATATAIAYAAFNLACLLLWLPIVHHRFLPGGHRGWLRDLAPSACAAAATAAVLVTTTRAASDPLIAAAVAGLQFALVAAIGVACHRGLRTALQEALHARRR